MGSQAGCSIDRPKPGGMIAWVASILTIVVTALVWASPFATNSVAKGGSSALFAAIRNFPSADNAISSTRVLSLASTVAGTVEIVCLRADALGALRSNTLTVLSPSPAYSHRPCAATPSGPEILLFTVPLGLFLMPTNPPSILTGASRSLVLMTTTAPFERSAR